MSNFTKELLGSVIEGVVIFAFVVLAAIFVFDAEPTGRGIAMLLVAVPIGAGLSGLVKWIKKKWFTNKSKDSE